MSLGPILEDLAIALPQEACGRSTAQRCRSRRRQPTRTSLSADMVFGDDGGIHVASMSGGATGDVAAIGV